MRSPSAPRPAISNTGKIIPYDTPYEVVYIARLRKFPAAGIISEFPVLTAGNAFRALRPTCTSCVRAVGRCTVNVIPHGGAFLRSLQGFCPHQAVRADDPLESPRAGFEAQPDGAYPRVFNTEFSAWVSNVLAIALPIPAPCPGGQPDFNLIQKLAIDSSVDPKSRGVSPPKESSGTRAEPSRTD